MVNVFSTTRSNAADIDAAKEEYEKRMEEAKIGKTTIQSTLSVGNTESFRELNIGYHHTFKLENKYGNHTGVKRKLSEIRSILDTPEPWKWHKAAP